MIKFVASKAVTETRSFQYTGGFSVKVGTTFEVGIPVIAQAGISLEVSTTHEFTTGTFYIFHTASTMRKYM